MVNAWAVRILLECILFCLTFCLCTDNFLASGVTKTPNIVKIMLNCTVVDFTQIPMLIHLQDHSPRNRHLSLNFRFNQQVFLPRGTIQEHPLHPGVEQDTLHRLRSTQYK